jgi:hypothetical protein
LQGLHHFILAIAMRFKQRLTRSLREFRFELKVSDASGLFSRDTVGVTVLNREIIFNLAWTNDSSNKMLFVQTPERPALYQAARINMAYLYRSGFTAPFGVTVYGNWSAMQEDGTAQGTYNCKIVNNTIMAYLYYDVYNFGYAFVGGQLRLVFR